MAILGYARISTSHQTHDQQLDALNAAGCERIFTDTMSGARSDRPGLAELMSYAREGDTIVVTALDRLGRSLSHVISTIDCLTERGIVLKSLREGIDYSTSTGKLVASIFAALAEYERSLINERAAAAREAARVRGRQVGRPKALTDETAGLAKQMRSADIPVPTIAKQLKVSPATVYRMLASA